MTRADAPHPICAFACSPACLPAHRAQFVALRIAITKWRHGSHLIPELPPRTFFAPAGCIGPAFLERRRIALQVRCATCARGPRAPRRGLLWPNVIIAPPRPHSPEPPHVLHAQDFLRRVAGNARLLELEAVCVFLAHPSVKPEPGAPVRMAASPSGLSTPSR